MKSILDSDVKCTECGWHGIVDECIPNIDNDGSLGCPACQAIVEEKVDDPARDH